MIYTIFLIGALINRKCMCMHCKGIIIYQTAYQSKTTILDDVNSMHHVYIKSNKIVSVGSLITYTKSYKRECCFGECIMIEDLPLLVAKADIYFLHHVFEIVYSFMPMGKTIDGIFEHLSFLYTDAAYYYVHHMSWKKLFLGRLLFLLGIYQEKEEPIVAFLHKINHVPIDRMSTESLDLAEEEAFNNWLLTIFTMHQKLNKFKIKYFIG